MTIPEQFTYAPAPGGWPPAGEWSQYQPPVKPRRRTGRLVGAVGGGLAALVLAAGGGFAAGWSMHPDSSSPQSTGYTAPSLPFNPGTGDGAQSGGGIGPGSGSAGSGSAGSGSGSAGSGSAGSGSAGSGSGSDGSGSAGSGSGLTGSGPTDAQVAAVAAKVDPALVDIDTVLGYQNGEAAGTGIVIGSDGVVLTNNHVVAGATSITVTDIGNQQSYRAAVVGYDRTGDIAVLKLSGASGLATAPVADAASVTSGDPVVAIGNAGGTGGTPSAVGGVISALDQSITAQDESTGSAEQLTGLIEVTADIQAGDSGGPLLTTSGQVIGVNTAASAGFQYQAAGGDGFAIPIGTATRIANQIRAGKSSGTVHIGETAYLGIETGGSSRDYAGAAGPVVLGVVTGSPAESAGLTRGDVINSVAGTTVDSPTALTELLDRYHPGDRVELTWTDLSGQSHSVRVRLATGPVG